MEHYETPELFELGEAAELTLGASGCEPDGCCGCYCGGGGIISES